MRVWRDGSVGCAIEWRGNWLFVDAITFDPNDITVDILQATPGDLNGNKLIDSSDIQAILATNLFNNSGA